MILVDTSVWIDHLRKPNPQLQQMLHNNQVLTHPLVLITGFGPDGGNIKRWTKWDG